MDNFSALIGNAPNFESLLRSAKMVAATDVTVLITGETGTGKEVLASALQKHSPRANKPFVTLNCAALAESIAESELFGHCKGAFTGATANQPGKLPAADGGTLFLDEVDSLSVPLQAKLLRFLETGECQAVGNTHTQDIDARVIAATNSDLNDKMAAGEFRTDLYFRLNVVPLTLPPLRERSGDVERLLKHFLGHFAKTHSLDAPRFSKSALNLLSAYGWPGNVRELRNLCERLSILLPGRLIEPDNLPSEFSRSKGFGKSPVFALPEVGVNLQAVEMDLIQQALSRTNGNRSKSARLLGISRDTLLYRMQKYNIAV